MVDERSATGELSADRLDPRPAARRLHYGFRNRRGAEAMSDIKGIFNRGETQCDGVVEAYDIDTIGPAVVVQIKPADGWEASITLRPEAAIDLAIAILTATRQATAAHAVVEPTR